MWSRTPCKKGRTPKLPQKEKSEVLYLFAEIKRGTVSDTQLLELSDSSLTPKSGSGFHPGLDQIKEAEHQRGIISDTHSIKSLAQVSSPIWAVDSMTYTKILKGLCQLLQLSGSCLTPKLDSGFHPGLGQIKEAEHQSSALPWEVLFQIPNS